MSHLRLVYSAPALPCLSLAAFEREVDYIFATLRRLGAAPGQVEYLAQEVFTVLHRSWATLDISRPLRPYLFGVAFRIVRAHRREQGRRSPYRTLNAVGGAFRPEGSLPKAEAIPLLLTALESIPIGRRAVVVMHDLDQVPVENVARTLSVSRFSAYASLRRGRKDLGAAVRRLSRAGSTRLTRHEPSLAVLLEHLLEQARVVRPLPNAIRARCLARVRTIAARELPCATKPIPSRSRCVLPLTLAFALGGVGAVVALCVGSPQSIAPEPTSWQALAPRLQSDTADPSTVSPSISRARVPQNDAAAKPRRSPRPVSAQQPYAGEVELLSRAQAARTDRDFAGALGLVDEHARRYPNGWLAEEREALRLQSLASLRRSADAAPAARAFANRFARSTLLPYPGSTRGSRLTEDRVHETHLSGSILR